MLRIVMTIVAMGVTCSGQVGLMEAVKTTLASHPQMDVQREKVAFANALVKQAGGVFDPVVDTQFLQSFTHYPLTGLQQLQAADAGFSANQSSHVSTVGPTISKTLRSGIQLSGGLNLMRSTDNVAQTQGVNLSQFRFQANVPLLRGRGREIVGAELAATRIESDAALLDWNHAAATLITDTATNYWQVVAAKQNLDVTTEAEERGRVLVANVRTLIDADRLPRSELQQVLANLASRNANRAAAEQRLIEATQSLALAMGLPAEQLIESMKVTDPLPDAESALLPILARADLMKWIDRALVRRADYLSLRRRQGAYEARRVAAADRLKPQFDLRFTTGYSGLQEGLRPDRLLVSPFTNVAGLDVIAGFAYSLPLGRHTAQAGLEQAVSLGHQNRLNTTELARNITSSVLSGIGAYNTAVVRVKEARASVDASQAALDGEREKLRLGVGSVVDLLTIEDRLTAARAAYVDASLNYAILLARLRFSTGTLIEPDRPAQTVKRDFFYRPPWEDDNP